MEQQLKNLTYGKSFLIGIALAAVYYFSVYNDGTTLENQISTAKNQLNQYNNEIATIQKAIKDAEDYKQTMNVLGVEMERVLKAVPSQLSSFDLMKIVSNVAKKLNVQINSLHSRESFRPGEKKDAIFENVGVEVDLTGTYNQIMQFMSELTSLDKIVTINALTLVAKVDTSRKGPPLIMITFRAMLLGYKYLETQDDKAKVAAPAPVAPKKEE